MNSLHHAAVLLHTRRLCGSLLRLMMLCAALGAAGTARAQLIDEIELQREGADAVMHIRFATPVQMLHAMSGSKADYTLIIYRVLPTQQTLNLGPAERRLPPKVQGTNLPGITVTDLPSSERGSEERRLQVRFSAGVSHSVRSGRDARTIDVVLSGLGRQLPFAGEDEQAASAAGLLRVTLEANEQAGVLSAAIPASLQNANVYTSRRVVDGRVLYETHVGPFATRAEAESALRAVRGRFPQAAITTEEAPAPAATVVAAVPVVPVVPSAPVLPSAPVVAALPSVATVSVAPPVQVVPAGPPAAPASAPAAQPPTSPASPASAPAVPAVPAAAPVTTAPLTDAERDQQAQTLLRSAQAALAGGATQDAIDSLGRLLDLPPNRASREAQGLIGQARAKLGDTVRARAEYEAFLRLYPSGADSDRVRLDLAALVPATPSVTAAQSAADKAAERARANTTTLLSGSASTYYYGGQSKVRTQEFQDSPIGGLPQLVSESNLSDTDQSLLVSSMDINWRHRDADTDQRFVFRDSYSKDFNRPEKSRNRLSALYYDHKSFALGTQVRLGRQSPLGGGVLGRFDGVQAGYTFKPRWKVNAVAGQPADKLLDTHRFFYGASVEAEALTPNLGGSLYVMEQKVDGLVDRRALGTEMRYFNGGLSLSGQLDQDILLKGLNIASLQGTWQRESGTVFNLLLDRRKTPLLMLGNALFFGGGTATRMQDLLAAGATQQSLRQQVRDTTADATQGSLGVTTPLSTQWQMGVDVRYTNIGAIAPVADLLPQGQPSSGDIWSAGLQFIGSNLYSARDTHVVIANFITGPTFQGQLLSYHNSSLVAAGWQLEPSFKYYRQTTSDQVTSTRWSPGLRVTWRYQQSWALESELSMESSKTISALRNESSTRTYYYLGGRFDF
jgi:tetratricopeptide (TPR) repeat protein